MGGRGSTGSQFLEGVAGKEEGDLFQGVTVFTKKMHKNLKCLLTKKVYKQKCFSVITKNLNWEILTKNFVTFKRWLGLRIKNFSIKGFTEKSDF